MKNKNSEADPSKPDKDSNRLEDYTPYHEKDELYPKNERLKFPDPDDYADLDRRNDNFQIMNEKDFSEDVSGDDLDVPGAELDDDMEAIGDEDEENNYYSLGGDDHENLEEDRGDYIP